MGCYSWMYSVGLYLLAQVSKAAAELMAYCEAHAKEDPLVTPVPSSENPFREKKIFCAILQFLFLDHKVYCIIFQDIPKTFFADSPTSPYMLQATTRTVIFQDSLCFVIFIHPGHCINYNLDFIDILFFLMVALQF